MRVHSQARTCLARGAVVALMALLIAACEGVAGPTGPSSPPSSRTQSIEATSLSPSLTTSAPTPPVLEPTEAATLPATIEDVTPSPEQASGTVATFGSPAFSSGGASAQIPSKYTCDGIEVSPPLEWNVPNADAISEFAVVVTDPDAGGLTHWVVARIPGTATGLDEGAGDPRAGNGLLQGKNSMGGIGYRGPCPPAGTTHHYHFALYAFGTPPDLSNVPTADEVRHGGAAAIAAFDALFGH